MMAMTLTKTRFAMALECPRKLDYVRDRNYYDARRDDEFLASLAGGGHQVGEVARLMYPGGHLITEADADAQVHATAARLNQPDVTIFEGTIRHGNLLVRCDVLEKHGNAVRLIEVKAKGFDPTEDRFLSKKAGGHPILSNWRPYLYDVAFQAYVLGLAYPAMTITPYLLLLDKTVPVAVPGLNTSLPVTRSGRRVTVTVAPTFNIDRINPPILQLHDVSHEVAMVLEQPIAANGHPQSFHEFVDEVSGTLERGDSFPVRAGPACKKCQFCLDPAEVSELNRSGWAECMAEHAHEPIAVARRETVFGLHRLSKPDTEKLLSTEPLKLAEISASALETDTASPEKITLAHRRMLQGLEARQGAAEPFILSEPLLAAIRAWRWPLHFIDFETSRPALPYQARRTPYDQILFQFSHHRLTADGRLEHCTQCIEATPGSESSIPVLRALRNALSSDTGTVLHWFTHEHTVLKDIRAQLLLDPPADSSELAQFLDALLGVADEPARLADLGVLIRQCVFYPGTGGSSSIKMVLPAVLQQSAALRARYGGRIYGTPSLPSHNFKNWQWVVPAGAGIRDPYDLLDPLFSDEALQQAITTTAADEDDEDSEFIKNGGAATIAYDQLQRPDLPASERTRLTTQLLRYCELDTLAMVMVYQALTGHGLS